MDRALFEKALKEMSQREGLTPEERIRRCVELCVQAQYMDSEQYLRMMHDSTKRPWVGLTDEEIVRCVVHHRFEYDPPYIDKNGTKHVAHYVIQPGPTYRNIDALLREKNTGETK